MKELILIIIAIVVLIAFIYVVCKQVDKRNHEKEMFDLLKTWPAIKEQKYSNPAEFSRKVLLLKEQFLPTTGGIFWKENQLKGWYFEMMFGGEDRFYPNLNTFGGNYAPSSYLDKKDMEAYYIYILERLGDYMYAAYVTNNTGYIITPDTKVLN